MGRDGMMERLLPYLLVGAGGFVGSNARFIFARWVGSVVNGSFPLATLLINLGLLAVHSGIMLGRVVVSRMA